MATSLGAEEVRTPVPRGDAIPTLKGVAEEEVDGEGLGVHGAAAAAVAVCISPLEPGRGFLLCRARGGSCLDSGRDPGAGSWNGEAFVVR